MLESQINCSCHISLSECKVKLHVLSGQNSSAVSGALYVQIYININVLKQTDQSLLNFVLFY